MRYLSLLSIFFLIVFTSCEDSKKSNKKILSQSSGKINYVSVVVDNELWEGSVGDAIRSVLAAPVDGLNQDEPLFNMNQIPPNVFSGFTTKSRTILKIEKGKPADTKIGNNVYAQPQRVAIVSGETVQDIVKQIKESGPKIVKAFKDTEIKERQKRIKKSLYVNDSLEKHFGVSIKFPSAYKIAKQDGTFFWARKDIPTGTTNFMVYELPLSAVKRNDSIASQVIRVRDSIGSIYVKGRSDGKLNAKGEVINSYMITEKAYAPFLFETIIDNKPTIETKGVWDLKGDFMSGPFINYMVEDKINNRYIVVEGFTFAPSVSKRDHMFELEAIIKSLEIK
ncbi:DUF4837 family protein [Lacinutrix salivirga]